MMHDHFNGNPADALHNKQICLPDESQGSDCMMTFCLNMQSSLAKE